MFTSNVKLRGAEPSEGIEPTLEQVSAIHQVIPADLVPFADFSLFGPLSKRLLAQTQLSPSGPSCATTPGNGRNCLDHPPLCFGGPLSGSAVLRFCCWTWHLLRSWTTTEKWSGASHSCTTILHNDACFVVYIADVPVRSEQFERLRERAERDHAALGAAGSTSNYDPAEPWGTVYAMSVADKEWWNEILHRHAVLYLARLKSAATAAEDGNAQPAPERSGRTSPGAGTPERSRGSRKHPRQSQESSGSNTPAGCPRSTSECPGLQACLCKALGHGMQSCSSSGTGTPPPPPPPTEEGQGDGTERAG